MNKDKKYQEMYGMFLDYEEKLHAKNQQKIKVGLKVNILLPLVFLIISFLTNGSKLIFLILWIVSLFGIAFYLIYVEFSDYKMQEKLKEFDLVNERESEVRSLIGEPVEAAESSITGKIDVIDDRIEEEKRRLEKEIEEEKKRMAAKLEKIKELAGSKENKDEKHN